MNNYKLSSTLAFLAASLAIVCLTSCGGGSGGGGGSTTSPPAQTVAISAVSPGTASVALGQTQTFSATVTGSSNTAITWEVNSTAGGNSQTGTISTAGLYTAPNPLPNPGQVTITAVAQADTTKTSSATVTVTSSVAVAAISPANPTVPAGGTEQFSAATSNDPGNLGVNWSVNGVVGGNSTAGTITSKGLYTAPAFPPSGGTVTITAVSVADSSKSASTTATISIANGSLVGNYAFVLTGEDAIGIESIAGSFVADGKGNLTSGLVDVNSVSGVQTNLAFTGTYSVGADGRGTAKITDAAGTFTFAFVLQSSQHGSMTEFDGKATIAGALDQQDTTAFSASALKGHFVFGFTGRDSGGSPADAAGLFTADGAGTISSGVEDVNDSGAISASQSFSGTYSVAASGRGTATFVAGGATANLAFYVVSANQVDYVGTDAGAAMGGAAYHQTKPTLSNFTDSSFSGTFFFYFASHVLAGPVGGNNGAPAVIGGVFTAGGGNINSGTLDIVAGNRALADDPLTGQYTVAANGRATGTLTYTLPVATAVGVTFYMISPTSAIILTTYSGAPVMLGTVTPEAAAQPATSYSNASVKGRYALSLLGAQFATPFSPQTDVGQIVADGNGNLTATEDINVGGTLSANVTSTGTYSATASGRGSASLGASNFIIYVVSPTQLFFIDNSNTGIRDGFANLQY